MNNAALELVGIERVFTTAAGSIHVLRGAQLALQPGELVGLLGPSGAGKSTLLHTAGLLERPDRGEVLIGGEPCSTLPDHRRTALRRRAIGFVYQFHHLLPEFSALENVVLPQMIDGISRGAAAKRAGELLTEVGLAQRLDHRPARLSGGEQQRVAIVRAMANRAKVLLADEPTGNLDPTTAAGVFDMLVRLVRSTGLAALVATHNVELARRMDRILVMKDGVLVERVEAVGA
jgi:lipoprotein-releasing system ATP-binding protein